MQIQTLSPVIGAEIRGIDISRPLDEESKRALLDAFARHHLLVFHDQRLDPQQQLGFATVFGPYIDTHIKSPEDNLQYISNTVAGGAVGNGTLPFHSDHSYFELPDTNAILLYAIEVPKSGGDTLFANTVKAYEDLPGDMKAKLRGLHALHAVYAGDQSQQAVQPLVWNEPVSGRPALYLSDLVKRIVELEPADGDPLLAALRSHLYREDLLYRHAWRVGDVVIWNNRILQHARTNFDPQDRRTLRRSTVGVPEKIVPLAA